ncbi:MAG: 30S ribosomal protein S20 [Epsilonproteobacteria bacterium]|nr:30S ribosomal protein S20 [Campylobacterota bacterium]
MAHHKSTIKSIRQSKKRYTRNKFYRTRLKNSIKAAKDAINSENVESAYAGDLLKKAVSVVNRISSKGIIPKGRAGRITSRLNLMFNKLKSKSETGAEKGGDGAKHNS